MTIPSIVVVLFPLFHLRDLLKFRNCRGSSCTIQYSHVRFMERKWHIECSTCATNNIIYINTIFIRRVFSCLQNWFRNTKRKYVSPSVYFLNGYVLFMCRLQSWNFLSYVRSFILLLKLKTFKTMYLNGKEETI